MSHADVEMLHTRLLVTLAQTVLVMHQTSYLPTRLREQLARQIGELEALTERYPATGRHAQQRHPDAGREEAQLLPWPPPKRDPAA